MSKPGAETVKKAVVERVKGGRPGPFRSFGASVIAGVATAVVTYRLLRSGG